MWPLIGLVLLSADLADETVVESTQPEFRVEVRIVEFRPIKGVTERRPEWSNHLHAKPALVVTPADVTSVQKRSLRGPTIGSRKTGFKHYPRLVVDLQLTEEAKLRLKTAVVKARTVSTTRTPIIATVVNDKYDGAWTKFVLDDPTSLVYWKKLGCRISFTRDEESADRLIKHFTKSKEKRSTDASQVKTLTTP